MNLHTTRVAVTITVDVTVDADAFTPQFMREFRQAFYNFQTLNEHIEHLAQLYVRGMVVNWPGEFIEGYGPREDMGIGFQAVDQDEEIVEI